MEAPALIELDPARAARTIAAGGVAPERAVRGAVELLLEGSTIPFIARYRKERTGALDEVALRAIDDALAAQRELIQRQNTVLKSIAAQGRLDAELRARIEGVRGKTELEDLYLPFKPKRRTRASAARERGLEPLADSLRTQVNPDEPARRLLSRFVDAEAGVPDEAAALAGACDILAEEWAARADLRAWLRGHLARGAIRSRRKRGYEGEDSRFESYYDFVEPLRRLASHRFLAMKRGEQEGALSLAIEVDDDDDEIIDSLRRRLIRSPRYVFARTLADAIADCYRRLLFPSIANETLAALKERADGEAIDVFAENLAELLLAPPAGPRVVLGIDPGFRTGCKVAVIDATGRLLSHATIHPTPPRRDEEGAARVLRELIERHGVEIIAIGNGTASRETDAFVTGLLRSLPAAPAKAVVSESGASVYSASDVAREEFPDLDLTIRGAISIARRLQDPLAELVKIDPRSIGVGQYQHDVPPARLQRALDRVVESCVNRVGVDLNTASAPLLSHVSGIGPRLANAIVGHRDEHGPFTSRDRVLSVPHLGAKAFEQSAGFLRIRGGEHPLDSSAVHPESYYVVERMAAARGVAVADLVGRPESLRGIQAADFVDERFGIPTIEDILEELAKPGRDPRREFRIARFADGVDDIGDLAPGMQLEGVVTNVTRFGAFVDVGVHQDGLVHVSQLAPTFVREPSSVVKVGDIIQVVVLDVDPRRHRISLRRQVISS